MDDKIRCQSCGMPIAENFGNLGTNVDKSTTSEYCIFCFSDGEFTQPNQTVDEMIQSSIDNMTTDLGMPAERASELANTVIPQLRRWKNIV